MTEHMTEWLGAYLDGELHGQRLHQIEAHLAECETCRDELNALRNLSVLLKETPPDQNFTSPESFATRVALQLPRRQMQGPLPQQRLNWRKTLEFTWRLIPAVLLVAWIFTQVVLAMSWVTSATDQLGLLGNAPAWLKSGGQSNGLVLSALSLFDGRLNETATQTLVQIGGYGWSTLIYLALQMVFALLLVSWLASWWIRRQHQNMTN